MTPAEALEAVLEATTSKKWHEAPAEILAGLRAAGYAIIPIEPDDAAIKRGASAIFGHWRQIPKLSAVAIAQAWDSLDPAMKIAWQESCRAAYAAVVKETE